MKRGRGLPAAVLVIFAIPLIPEILGHRLLDFRDAFITHFPIKLYALDRLRHGIVPFINFGASNGEPLLPDPNTVSLYPTNFLYFIFSPAAAFNLHLLVHVVWAFLGAAFLARRMGVRRDWSWLAGVVYAFSGGFLSYAAAFTNSAAAAAWAPWAVAAMIELARAACVKDGVRRRQAILGAAIAFGIQALAGEPAICAWTAALALFSAVAITARKETSRRTIAAFLLLGTAATALGVALAAPQILSTLRALPYSFRGEMLFPRDEFGAAANVPVRLLELFFPLCFGAPRPMVSGAFWAFHAFDSLQPYLYSVTAGLAPVVAMLAAFCLPAFRRQKIVVVVAVAGLVSLLLSFGWQTPLFSLLYAVKPLRHFRYPVKFVLPATLCVALLGAHGAQTLAITVRRRALLWLSILTAVPLAAGGVLVLAAPEWLCQILAPEFAGLQFGPGQMLPGIFRIVERDAVFGLLALALLMAAALRQRWNRPGVYIAAALLCLLPAGWPLFVAEQVPRHPEPPPLTRMVAGKGRLYAGPVEEFAVAKFGANHSYSRDDITELISTGKEELWPLTALPGGVVYTYDTDPDGSYGFLDRALSEAAAGAPTSLQKSNLLRAASAGFYLKPDHDPLPGFHLIAEQTFNRRTLCLFAADRVVPPVRLATRVWRRYSLSGAIEVFKHPDFDPSTDVIVRGNDANPAPEPSLRTSRLSWDQKGNGFRARISSPVAGVALFAVTYFKYWKAAIDGNPSPVEIADGNFCGVRVPPGDHTVTLKYDETPFRRGALLTLIFLAASALMLLWPRKPPSLPGPAE